MCVLRCAVLCCAVLLCAAVCRVYSVGLHELMGEVTTHCAPDVAPRVMANVWRTYAILMEDISNTAYLSALQERTPMRAHMAPSPRPAQSYSPFGRCGC
jgi:hypothetical protein